MSRQRDRLTDRQTYRHVYRQAERQTDRHTHMQAFTHTYKWHSNVNKTLRVCVRSQLATLQVPCIDLLEQEIITIYCPEVSILLYTGALLNHLSLNQLFLTLYP